MGVSAYSQGSLEAEPVLQGCPEVGETKGAGSHILVLGCSLSAGRAFPWGQALFSVGKSQRGHSATSHQPERLLAAGEEQLGPEWG